MLADTLRQWGDRVLGRGSAAITVPVMDGPLKANRVLDDAAVVASLAGIDDVASDGAALYVSAGPCVYRLDGGKLVEIAHVDGDITAMAAGAQGLFALAVAGRAVSVRRGADGREVAHLDALAGQPMACVNALAFDADGALLLSDGALRRGPAQWCLDLMEHGNTGRVARWRFAAAGGGAADLIAGGQHHAFGVLPLAGAVLHSESWRHRVVATDSQGRRKLLLAELPGYPSRMAPARDGGFWLSCFVCRTQLVEFVLREDAYRRRMIDEIDPRYWIAPALASGRSFLEPLQGAGVKTMGVLKPWAPPRSYGLVLKVTADGRVAASLHSQVDGRHHGVTAMAEQGGSLYVASKGSGRLLRVALDGLGASA